MVTGRAIWVVHSVHIAGNLANNLGNLSRFENDWSWSQDCDAVHANNSQECKLLFSLDMQPSAMTRAVSIPTLQVCSFTKKPALIDKQQLQSDHTNFYFSFQFDQRHAW